MNESHYVGLFFRLWGAQEGAANINPDDALLNNSQNDFDAKFGDVAARVGTRYFLVEFKKDRDGLATEVDKTLGKPHRYHLYQHLRVDSSCRSLARVGHFGAFPNKHGQLEFEPYAHAVAPIQSKAQIVNAVMMNDEAYHELNYQAWNVLFDEFYKEVTNSTTERFTMDKSFFANGLGLTKDQLEKYVRCMYQHLQAGTNKNGKAVLCAYDASKQKLVPFISSIEDLIQKLHNAFNDMAEATQVNIRPPIRD